MLGRTNNSSYLRNTLIGRLDMMVKEEENVAEEIGVQKRLAYSKFVNLFTG